MRDIENYVKNYHDHTFETEMLLYRRRKVLEILNAYQPRHLLEVGCGEESLFASYESFESFTVVEPSGEFCKTVRSSEKCDRRIRVIESLFENAVEALKGQPYDCVVVSSLLHEVEDPDRLLRAVRQVCNGQTLVHINVPNARGFHLLWAFESGLIPSLGELTPTAQLLQQHNAYDINRLCATARRNGFTVLESGSSFIKPFNHAKMTECLRLGLVDRQLLDGLYRMTKHMPDLGADIFVNCRAVEVC
jgi:hypothetical protein